MGVASACRRDPPRPHGRILADGDLRIVSTPPAEIKGLARGHRLRRTRHAASVIATERDEGPATPEGTTQGDLLGVNRLIVVIEHGSSTLWPRLVAAFTASARWMGCLP